MSHPCLSCGACCATWPVQLERKEVTPALRPHVVPADRRHVVLATTVGGSRCAALNGDIGSRCGCGIYPIRPSPCREVQPSMADGTRDPTCDEARKRHGLPRLSIMDWR